MSLDVLVVGGGPVGLVTALHARRRGLSVEIIEPRGGPVDKACGEGIMPAGLAHLAGLGVRPPGHAIRGIRYTAGDRSVSAVFTAGAGRGVRRTGLHQSLTDAAQAAGIVVRRSSVTAISDGPQVATAVLRDGSARQARFIVGADGLHSTVRRLCGLEVAGRPRARRRGLRQHFAAAPWTDLVEVHWAKDAEAYVTPVGSDSIGVAVLSEQTAGFAEQLARFGELSERLGGVAACSKVTGAGPLRQRSRARTRGRVALVGDAAGYIDAITGEGLTVGWRQAEALADALADGSLQDYERRWRRCTLRSTALTTGLVAMARHRPTRGLIVPAAVRMPGLFGRVVDAVSRG